MTKAEYVALLAETGLIQEALSRKTKVGLGAAGAVGAGLLAHHLMKHGHHEEAGKILDQVGMTAQQAKEHHDNAHEGAHGVGWKHIAGALGAMAAGYLAHSLETRGVEGTISHVADKTKNAWNLAKGAFGPHVGTPIS
jgi:hypothetical protein